MCRTHAKQLYCFLRALSSNDENTHFLDLPSDKHFGWKSRYSSSSHFLDAVGAGRDFDDIELDNLLYNGFTSNSLDPTCTECPPPSKTTSLKVHCTNFSRWYSLPGNGAHIAHYEVIEDNFTRCFG